jgi:hypothetical protein
MSPPHDQDANVDGEPRGAAAGVEGRSTNGGMVDAPPSLSAACRSAPLSFAPRESDAQQDAGAQQQ